MAKGQNDDIKKWLSGYRDAKRVLANLDEEYQELVSFQETAHAIRYDGVPGSGGVPKDLSDAMAKRCECLGDIVAARRKAEDRFYEIRDAIHSLGNANQETALTLRYITLTGMNLTPWTDIASKMGYTREHVGRIHGEALEALKAILNGKREDAT